MCNVNVTNNNGCKRRAALSTPSACVFTTCAISVSHSALGMWSRYVGYYGGPNGNYWDPGAACCVRNVGNYLPGDPAYRLRRPESFSHFIAFLRTEWSLDISVVQASRPRAGRFGVWFPRGVNDFLFSKTAKSDTGAHPTHHPLSGYRCSFAEVKQPGVILATHRCLMKRVGRNGAVPSLFLYVFMSWTLTFTIDFRTNVLYFRVALICAECQSVEVLVSVLLRRPTSCLFLEL
jgi:hypothetical protein